VINDILDFSKIEAGKIDIEVIDFDLRVVVEEAAKLVAPKADEKDLELAVMVDPQMPTPSSRGPGQDSPDPHQHAWQRGEVHRQW